MQAAGWLEIMHIRSNKYFITKVFVRTIGTTWDRRYVSSVSGTTRFVISSRKDVLIVA